MAGVWGLGCWIMFCSWQCLMEHYEVTDSLPKAELPGLILSAETELGITAGLQDRVIQVYEGMVYMVRTDLATSPSLRLHACMNHTTRIRRRHAESLFETRSVGGWMTLRISRRKGWNRAGTASICHCH